MSLVPREPRSAGSVVSGPRRLPCVAVVVVAAAQTRTSRYRQALEESPRRAVRRLLVFKLVKVGLSFFLLLSDQC
jgi:hypothetical protein